MTKKKELLWAQHIEIRFRPKSLWTIFAEVEKQHQRESEKHQISLHRVRSLHRQFCERGGVSLCQILSQGQDRVKVCWHQDGGEGTHKQCQSRRHWCAKSPSPCRRCPGPVSTGAISIPVLICWHWLTWPCILPCLHSWMWGEKKRICLVTPEHFCTFSLSYMFISHLYVFHPDFPYCKIATKTQRSISSTFFVFLW